MQEPLMTWQVDQLPEYFSKLLTASLEQGPQVLARETEEMAVLVPISQWRELQSRTMPEIGHHPASGEITLKDWLLAETPRAENLMVPQRGQWGGRRDPVEL